MISSVAAIAFYYASRKAGEGACVVSLYALQCKLPPLLFGWGVFRPLL